MSIRFPFEHKFRIDAILRKEWKRAIPVGRGDGLIRAFMNKLAEEAERGGSELLFHIEAGNFSLIKSTIRKVNLNAPVHDKDPRTGRFLPNKDKDVPYHHSFAKE